MFAARFNSKCNRCYGSIAAGEMIAATPQRTYAHVACPAQPGTDPLIAAVVARENAEDEFFAAEYRWHLMGSRHGSGWAYGRMAEARQRILQAMVDARMRALLEADAYGLIDLFNPLADGETIVDRSRQTLRFAGAEEDIAMSNAFGEYEAEQERKAFERGLELEMEFAR